MPVSRSRKKRKKNSSSRKKRKIVPYEVVKHKLVEVESLFPDDLPFDERLKVFLDIAEKANQGFEEDFHKTTEYLKEYDPLYLISFCAYYFVSSLEGVDKEAIDGGLEFHPFYIEVLQCMALFHERTISAAPLLEKAEDFKETLQRLNTNQTFGYYKMSESATCPEDLNPILVRMEMMVHTLAVRNWAYEHQMKRISYDLAAEIEAKFIEKYAFSPSLLLDILFGLVDATNEKLNRHVNKLRTFWGVKKPAQVFERYEEVFPDVKKTDGSERESIWQQVGRNLKTLKSMFLSHSDFELADIFTFSLEEIAKTTEFTLTDERLTAIMDQLSHKFGELSDFNRDHIFLDNPIHSNPFIKLENGYFSAITYMFPHIALEMLESFISRDANLQTRYNDLKGKYLEKTLYKLFKQAFPGAQIFQGSLWRCPQTGKTFENDLIVLIEDFAIIVEAKSGNVNPSAKRGGDRLFKVLKDLVVAPSEQAIRFQSFLEGEQKVHQFDTKSGKKNIIDSTKINYYVPLGITLIHLASIGCNLKKIVGAKITDYSINELAPSISISDLEIIFELLPSVAEKIHYLSRRREFGAHVHFQGDELDLLAFYLEYGFNIGDDEYEGKLHLNITGKSKELDPYILGTYRGKTVQKPSLQLTEFWKDILQQLEANKGVRWLHSSYILLGVSFGDQKQFEQAFFKVKKAVSSKTARKDHNWMALTYGPKNRKYVLVGYPYTGITKDTRNDIMNEIVLRSKTDEIKGIVIIGQNLDKGLYPYSVIAGDLDANLFNPLSLE